jgi:hypothetical protein
MLTVYTEENYNNINDKIQREEHWNAKLSTPTDFMTVDVEENNKQ